MWGPEIMWYFIYIIKDMVLSIVKYVYTVIKVFSKDTIKYRLQTYYK